jgi:hypothetical protein
MPIILATWEAEIGRIMVPDQLRQVFLETPISKIIRTKWTESVAQGVERLLCKCEPLSSNFSPTKKKKKKRQKSQTPRPKGICLTSISCSIHPLFRRCEVRAGVQLMVLTG